MRAVAVLGAAATVAILLVSPARAGSWGTGYASSYSAASTGSDVQGCPGAPRLRGQHLSVATRLVHCGARVQICAGRRCVITTRWDSGPYAAGRDFDLNVGVVRALGFVSSLAWGVRAIRWRRVA